MKTARQQADVNVEERKSASGVSGLAEAIIAQACTDYRKLVEEGIVEGDHVVESFKKRKVLEGAYTHPDQCQQLISWLKDGSLREMLDVTNLKIDADWLLSEIGVTA